MFIPFSVFFPFLLFLFLRFPVGYFVVADPFAFLMQNQSVENIEKSLRGDVFVEFKE